MVSGSRSVALFASQKNWETLPQQWGNITAKAEVQVTPVRSERCCNVLILPAAALDLLNTTSIIIFRIHLFHRQYPLDSPIHLSMSKFFFRPLWTFRPDLPFSSPMAGCYDMLGKVGQGAFGVVWRARVKATGAIVAIKVKTGRWCRFIWRIACALLTWYAMKDINMASSKDGIDKSAIDEIRLMQVSHVHLWRNIKCPHSHSHISLNLFWINVCRYIYQWRHL